MSRAREELARAQAELMRALELGEPVPAGFDAERVRTTADTLLAKRRRGVRRAWPVLERALGEAFAGEFDAWARAHPPRAFEPHAGLEGYRFALALHEQGRLPREAEAEVLGFGVRWRLTATGGLAPRRGLVFRVLRMGEARRWRWAVRLPGGRVLRGRLPGG
jgi:hypothetical protein